jgi:hypothetical protein
VEQTWDIDFPRKVADAGAKFIKEYLAELRDQGKTKGKLSLVVRQGKTRLELKYRE